MTSASPWGGAHGPRCAGIVGILGRVSIATCLWLLPLQADSSAAFDQIYLRSGEVWAGTVFKESDADYLFVPSDSAGGMRRVPRDAVRFVLYADAAKADRALGLSDARRLCKDPSLVAVQILTAAGMGAAISDAARDAQTSIWIAAYFLSGSRIGSIGDFYATLEAKARAGVEVVIVAEYGQATPPSVKNTTRNFLTELARGGMWVYLHADRKALHKKLLIVDRRVVFLGSSNLTLAGTFRSNEMNLRVDSPAFVRQVVSDFQDLQKRAIALEEWEDDRTGLNK